MPVSISLADLEFLQSTAGGRILKSLESEDLADQNMLPLVSRLRKQFSADEVHAAITTARLRRQAGMKFGDAAAEMFFTPDSLQQASDPQVRTYRAARLSGVEQLLDVCCGIGADSIAYASAGAEVLGLDIDPVRIAIARHNAGVVGLTNARFEQHDVKQGIPAGYHAVFYDPARRDHEGRRIFDVEAYIPPLSLVQDWGAPTIAVKLSPGVDMGQLESYGGQVEFISVEGELKEAVMWLDRKDHPVATLITGGAILHWNDKPLAHPTPIAAPMAWLVEPDPALIRAGLVANVAKAFNGCQLDPTIAYFTCEQYPDSPWVKAWKVLDWMPFNLKKLRRYLQQRNAGSVTVKKRGSPIAPEHLQSQLRLKDNQSFTLVVTRFNGKATVLICADFQPR